MSNAVRVGKQIGTLRWNGVQPGLERDRQTHQGTLQIECWQCFVSADDDRDASHAGEQIFQRRLHLENHFGAQRGDEWHVAHELDGVAETLL